MIRIFNKREGSKPVPDHFRIVDCTNPGPLGNPFARSNMSAGQRLKAIADYEIHFEKVKKTQAKLLAELSEAAKHEDIALLCWCEPRPCHCAVIKAFLEQKAGLVVPGLFS